MVSGWDKNPGPDNHYASSPPSRLGTLKAIGVLLVVVTGFFAYRYYR